MSRLPTYFLSHGGGPWPYMKEELGGRFDKLEASLIELRHELGDRPRAVLMVSGHWETPEFAVSSAARPSMVYDYHGFPEHTYRIKYGAPGSPELAARVQALLQDGGLVCLSDDSRGFDHGTFSLMKPLYPDADMPVVQLSLKADLDPQTHVRAGKLLAPLRDDGVVIPNISAPMKTATPICSTARTITSSTSTRTRFPPRWSTASGRSRCTGQISSW